MQGVRRWPIDWRDRKPPSDDRPKAIVVPDFPAAPGLPLELAALLPNHAFNRQLLEGLIDRPPWAQQADIAACFMADPFLNPAAFAKQIRRKGFSRLCNLPTIAHFGSGLAAMSDEVGLGPARERERLESFRDLGLEVFAVVTDRQGWRRVAPMAPAGVIVGRGFESEADDLPQTAAAVAADVAGRCPVLMLAGERFTRVEPPLAGVIHYGSSRP